MTTYSHEKTKLPLLYSKIYSQFEIQVKALLDVNLVQCLTAFVYLC